MLPIGTYTCYIYANVVNDNSNNYYIHSKNNYTKPTIISSEGEFTNVINKSNKK